MTRLSLLVELASMLAREVDLDAWLASAADKLAEAMEAERARARSRARAARSTTRWPAPAA